MENDNNFGYEKITIVVNNMPLSKPLEIRNEADTFLFEGLFS
jgi:hypothetical protein